MSSTAHTLSSEELRLHLLNHVQHSGALKYIKTQLRAILLTEMLQKQTLIPESSSEASIPPKCGIGTIDNAETDSISSYITDRLILEHLKQKKRLFSYALFCSESNIQEEIDISEQQIVGRSQAENELCDLLGFVSSDSADESGMFFPFGGKSLLEYMVLVHLKKPTNSNGISQSSDKVQNIAEKKSIMTNCSVLETTANQNQPKQLSNTETHLECKSLCKSSIPASLSIQQRFAMVDAHYALRYSEHGESLRAEMDRQMRQFRIDFEAEQTVLINSEIKRFRQEEAEDIRAEAKRHYECLLKLKQEEWKERERVIASRLVFEQENREKIKKDNDTYRLNVERRYKHAILFAEEREDYIKQIEQQLKDIKENTQLATYNMTKANEQIAALKSEISFLKLSKDQLTDDIRHLQSEYTIELQIKEKENYLIREELDRLQAFAARTTNSQVMLSASIEAQPSKSLYHSNDSISLAKRKSPVHSLLDSEIQVFSNLRQPRDAYQSSVIKPSLQSQISSSLPVSSIPKIDKSHILLQKPLEASVPSTPSFDKTLISETSHFESLPISLVATMYIPPQKPDAITGYATSEPQLSLCDTSFNQGFYDILGSPVFKNLENEEEVKRNEIIQISEQEQKQLNWTRNQEHDRILAYQNTRKTGIASDLVAMQAMQNPNPDIILRRDSSSDDDVNDMLFSKNMFSSYSSVEW